MDVGPKSERAESHRHCLVIFRKIWRVLFSVAFLWSGGGGITPLGSTGAVVLNSCNARLGWRYLWNRQYFATIQDSCHRRAFQFGVVRISDIGSPCWCDICVTTLKWPRNLGKVLFSVVCILLVVRRLICRLPPCKIRMVSTGTTLFSSWLA